MLKLKVILLMLLTLVVASVNAEQFNHTDESLSVDQQNEDYSKSTDIGTSRKKHHQKHHHHHHLLIIGSALLGLGGLHALAMFYAINLKIIVVAVIMAISTYYYLKIYLTKVYQHTKIIRERNPFDSFSNYGPIRYSADFRPGSDVRPHILSFDHHNQDHHEHDHHEHDHHEHDHHEHDHHEHDHHEHDHHLEHHIEHESIPDSFMIGFKPAKSSSLLLSEPEPSGPPPSGPPPSAEETKMIIRVYNPIKQVKPTI